MAQIASIREEVVNEKILRNSIILSALRILDPLCSMVLVITISRTLGPQTLGAYSFIVTFTSMFGAVSQLGLQELLVREVSRRKDLAAKYLSSANLIGMCSSALIIIALNHGKIYFGISGELQRIVLIMSFSVIPAFICYSFESVFMAFEKMHLIFYYQAVATTLRVSASLVSILMGYGLWQLVVITLATGVASVLMCGWLFAKNIGKLSVRADRRITWELLRKSPVFLLLTLVSIISARVDVLLLTKLSNLTQVAFYAAAYRLFETTMVLPQAYVKAHFPQMSQLFREDYGRFSRLCAASIKHVSYYVVFVTVVFIMLSEFMVRLIYGNKFAGAGSTLTILMLGLLPWAWGRVFANELVASEHQGYDLVGGVLASVANFGLNLWLIPRYGVGGAAIANTISLSVFCVAEYVGVRCVVKGVRTLPEMRLALAAGLAACLLIYLAKISMIVLLLEVAISCVMLLWYCRRHGGVREALRRPGILIKEML